MSTGGEDEEDKTKDEKKVNLFFFMCLYESRQKEEKPQWPTPSKNNQSMDIVILKCSTYDYPEIRFKIRILNRPETPKSPLFYTNK